VKSSSQNMRLAVCALGLLLCVSIVLVLRFQEEQQNIAKTTSNREVDNGIVENSDFSQVPSVPAPLQLHGTVGFLSSPLGDGLHEKQTIGPTARSGGIKVGSGEPTIIDGTGNTTHSMLPKKTFQRAPLSPQQIQQLEERLRADRKKYADLQQLSTPFTSAEEVRFDAARAARKIDLLPLPDPAANQPSQEPIDYIAQYQERIAAAGDYEATEYERLRLAAAFVGNGDYESATSLYEELRESSVNQDVRYAADLNIQLLKGE